MRPAERFDSLFQYYAQPATPWQWLRAQARAESGTDLNPDAVSHVGAKGLAQFMKPTWIEIQGEHKNPRNPEHAIEGMAIYMNILVKKFGDLSKAQAAYNCGMGRLMRLLEQEPDNWKPILPAETQTYLRRIEKYYQEAEQW